MKILIDWDSTINQFDQTVCDSLNARFGTEYHPGIWTNWDWPRNIPPEQVDYVWKDLFRDREWTMTIPPDTGARMAVNRLIDAGHEVHVVTSRFKYMQPWLEDWLRIYGFDRKVVAVSDSKKGLYAENQGVDTWIEDAPHNAWNLSLVSHGYLVDRPWNRLVQKNGLNYSIIRVPSVWVATEDILGGEHAESYRGSLGRIPSAEVA